MSSRRRPPEHKFIIEQAKRYCHGNSGLRPRSHYIAKGLKIISYKGYRVPSEIFQQANDEGEALGVLVQSRRNKRAAESGNRRS